MKPNRPKRPRKKSRRDKLASLDAYTAAKLSYRTGPAPWPPAE